MSKSSKTSTNMSMEDMAKTIAELQAQLQAEREKNKPTIELKVSEKGGVSVYMGARYPITLYSNQWITLMENKDKMLQFIEDNKDKLSIRNNKPVVKNDE